MQLSNIYTSIRSAAGHRAGDKAAVREGANTVTYDQLFCRVERVAEWLATHGVQPVSRVALFCGDGTDYIVSSLAVLSLQAVIVPVPPSSTEEEMSALTSRIDADFLLFDEALCTWEGERFDDAVAIEGRLSLRVLTAPPPSPEFIALNPAFVRFSSGTTGSSKGVLLSHEAILERTDAADVGLCITADDTVLWVLSMSYHFVVSILLFLRRGAEIVLCYDSFPIALQDVVSRGEGTFIYAAPFHYYTMTASRSFAPDGLKNIRMAISTSMKLQADVAESFADKFGFGLTEAYGIIEVGLPFINRTPLEAQGSVGRMLPDYELKLRNKDKHGIGEILIRGRGMFSAYISPWHARAAGEWFESGDLGYVDDDGNLFICGRKKGLINFMGMKVFPEEVEAVLDAHPAVSESLVYGENHARYGQLPCAKVVREGDVDEGALRKFCLRELSPQKVPKSIHFVESLPRTKSGKLKRS